MANLNQKKGKARANSRAENQQAALYAFRLLEMTSIDPALDCRWLG